LHEDSKSREIESLWAENAILHKVINNLNTEVKNMKLEVMDAGGTASWGKYK
jgi:hypothetical protein